MRMAPLRSYALIDLATAATPTTSGRPPRARETTVAFSERAPGNKNILGAIVNIHLFGPRPGSARGAATHVHAPRRRPPPRPRNGPRSLSALRALRRHTIAGVPVFLKYYAAGRARVTDPQQWAFWRLASRRR